MEYLEMDGTLQLWPLNARTLDLYFLFEDRMEGVMKLVGRPPSKIV
jgi:hypothetical protein